MSLVGGQSIEEQGFKLRQGCGASLLPFHPLFPPLRLPRPLPLLTPPAPPSPCSVEIVVGTPGRFKDCIERRYTVLDQCNYIVLDEADRMIDLGLEKEVLWVLDAMPSSNLKPFNGARGGSHFPCRLLAVCCFAGASEPRGLRGCVRPRVRRGGGAGHEQGVPHHLHVQRHNAPARRAPCPHVRGCHPRPSPLETAPTSEPPRF